MVGKPKICFRVDDVSVNTDPIKLENMIKFIDQKCAGSELTILLGVSLLVSVQQTNPRSFAATERIFPSIWNAFSDHRVFYGVDKLGHPTKAIEAVKRAVGSGTSITIASHGLIHVDHRLLGKETQELSILVSCNLTESRVFIPPFNKWNKNTEEVCNDHSIKLVKFETGNWKHVAHERPTADILRKGGNFYFHTHDFKSVDDFEDRFKDVV